MLATYVASGTPRVQCLPDRFFIEVRTLNPFVGRIFSKGQSKRAGCMAVFNSNSSLVEVSFSLNECGMMRERKLYPSAGLMLSLTIVISFHSFFITKADQAFSVKCFYAQARFATLEHFVNVSSLVASEIPAYDTTAAECNYVVRVGGPDGEVARFVEVGQRLFHEWTCSGSDDLHILIKDCRVADDTGEQFRILDDRGCAVDPVIVGDLVYGKGAKEAHVYSYAFKFADTSHVAFQCTVQLCSDLEDDQQCSSISPPSCSVGRFDANMMTKSYLKRLSDASLHDEIDVHSHMMAILDTKINNDQHQMSRSGLSSTHDSHRKFGGEVCISQSSFVAYGISGMILVSAALFVICVQCIALRRSRTEAQPHAC
uniref:ZP domain-containing protein n=1 Tax=Parascaris univalens TaxID=6257 RepID=A0A915BVY6_PARUN